MLGRMSDAGLAHFPAGYAAAREAFRSAAEAAGATLGGEALPTRSVRGEELSIDTAYLGPELPDAVAAFWLTRSQRSLPRLLVELQTLDTAAMAAQRRLTIPLLKEVLSL